MKPHITQPKPGARRSALLKSLLYCCFILSTILPQQLLAFKMMPGTECRTEIQWGLFECIQPRGVREVSFFGKVGVYNAYSCTPMDYYISAVDPATGLTNGTVTLPSGPLGAGWNVITFTYDPDPGVTAVRFVITFTCGGKLGYKVCRSTLGEFDNLDDRKLYPCRDYFKVAPAPAEQVNMILAPNPAGNEVRVSYQIPTWKAQDAYHIVVTNLMGQTVAQYAVTSARGQWQYDASQLSSGTYLVQLVKDGVHTDVQRLIITH